MSSFDPLAALAVDAALTQSAIAAIDLGVQIEILQSQLSIGDLITATVLPPQDGSDRLSLLGQTVLAQLPPGVDPGESLLLQVTGFQGNQILVRNIGVVDPANPPPTVTVSLPQPEFGAPVQATLTTIVPPKNVPAAVPSEAPPNAASSSVAPPRAVFVAASVQPAQTVTESPAPVRIAPTLAPNVPALGERLDLEARIVATRAASIDLSELVAPGPQKSATSQTGSAGTLPARAPQAPVIPPKISIAPELALLARLRIAPLPFTLAAARIASSAAAALPRALARVEALLANVAHADARAATVRTLVAFTSRLDPSNARALPEQLMAYVSNVVDGAEAKLASIVRLLAQSAAPETAADAAERPASPVSTPIPAQQPVVSDRAVTPQAQTSTVAAHVAERSAALAYDLKAAIASLLETPPRGAPPQLAAALGEALTTLTGVQLNVLNGQNGDPSTLVIPLPVFYHEGGRPAQLRISRDAPRRGKKLDADNFHISFVLDTRSLGTVAVDVQTASRSVSVNVKTEASNAATRFKETFDDLRGRLEQLHYRVANIAAGVAPRRVAGAGGIQPNAGGETDGQRTAGLDIRA